MAARIPTRVKAIVEKLAPLVEFYKNNNLPTKTIHIFHTDWLFLVKQPLANIRPSGFNITREGGLTFGLFTLKPVKATVTKENESK